MQVVAIRPALNDRRIALVQATYSREEKKVRRGT
jgi:hypothetical protein